MIEGGEILDSGENVFAAFRSLEALKEEYKNQVMRGDINPENDEIYYSKVTKPKRISISLEVFVEE